MAEDVYTRLNQLREQMSEMRETVVETRDRVDELDTELAEQRAILNALAEERGVDVEAITTEVHVADAEKAAVEDGGGAADDATPDT
jgi:predicted nuclease with TOPRIM domain